MRNFNDKSWYFIGAVMAVMLVYFLLGHSVMMDDGFHYEGFAESLARGHLDFKSFYGFHGLSFLSVPVFWLTHSNISIVITSIILFLLSIPLAYLVGREYHGSKKAGLIFMSLILLTPYPYTTMMRGFQEAALLFFILLIIYGSLKHKNWTPLAWAVGGIVKPFALVLFPLFLKHSLKTPLRSSTSQWAWVFILLAFFIGVAYLGASYYQTGHLVNNAAINSYQGNFNTGNPPPLVESFGPSIKSFGRVAANLFVYSRKILISPLVILLGLGLIFKNKNLLKRKGIFLAIALNFLLVGSLTFSFQKYLLPAVVLLALVSVSALVKNRLLQLLVLVDSIFVFNPIYSYFGRNFWSSRFLFSLPILLSAVIFLGIWFFENKKSGH